MLQYSYFIFVDPILAISVEVYKLRRSLQKFLSHLKNPQSIFFSYPHKMTKKCYFLDGKINIMNWMVTNMA